MSSASYGGCNVPGVEVAERDRRRRRRPPTARAGRAAARASGGTRPGPSAPRDAPRPPARSPSGRSTVASTTRSSPSVCTSAVAERVHREDPGLVLTVQRLPVEPVRDSGPGRRRASNAARRSGVSSVSTRIAGRRREELPGRGLRFGVVEVEVGEPDRERRGGAGRQPPPPAPRQLRHDDRARRRARRAPPRSRATTHRATAATTATATATTPHHGRSSCSAAVHVAAAPTGPLGDHARPRPARGAAPREPRRSRRRRPSGRARRPRPAGTSVTIASTPAAARRTISSGSFDGPGVHRDADGVRLVDHRRRRTVGEDPEERVDRAVPADHRGARSRRAGPAPSPSGTRSGRPGRGRARGRSTAGGTRTPARGRRRPRRRGASTTAGGHRLVGVEVGVLGRVLDLDVHQQAPALVEDLGQGRAATRTAARMAARSCVGEHPEALDVGVVVDHQRRRPGCGGRRAPRRRRRPPGPARRPPGCSPGPAGASRGDRARGDVGLTWASAYSHGICKNRRSDPLQRVLVAS